MLEIDVERVLRSKSPKLADRMPRFLVNYLRRIVHEDEVNHILRSFSHLPPPEFIRSALEFMDIGYRSEGLDAIDPSGRYIFASNHPFGGLDGLMLAVEIESRFGDVRVVVNDLLMFLEPLRPLFIPVNKHGRQSSGSVSAFNRAFEDDTPIVTFPAGLCSRRRRGIVADPPWKKNFVRRAAASGRDIVPVYFEGRLSDFFYRLSNLRTRLGVKANIEMLYLADEMFRQGGGRFVIRFGRPVPWSEIAAADPRQVTEEVRRRAYALKNVPRART